MKRIGIITSLFIAMLAITASGSSFTSDYNYNRNITMTNETGSTVAQPVQITVNASEYITNDFVQDDAEDVTIDYLGYEEKITVCDLTNTSAKWRTEYVEINSGNSIKKTLWFGDADASRDQAWIASGSDTCSIVHNGSFNFATTNFAIESIITPATTPGTEQLIFQKPGEYQLSITTTPKYRFTVWDNGATPHYVEIIATVGGESDLVAWYDGSDLVISDGTNQDSETLSITLDTGVSDPHLLECDCIIDDLRVVAE